MHLLYLTFVLVLLIIVSYIYFRLADHYDIIDKPNQRSSHSEITIRGGGIIFPISVIIFFFLANFQYLYFTIALFLISLISFLDDLLTLNNKVRLLVHLISVGLLFCEWEIYGASWYLLIGALIFVVGTLNAYNFMDGINGITGFYSLVTICSLFYVNHFTLQFVSEELVLIVGLSLLVFNFFNFRNKAKCFAGDVGSVSIAFILIFLIGKLVLKSTNYTYILFLLIYGLDAAVTIGFRLIRKENIFEAHRSHFYQYLVNEKKIPHLYVSTGYGVLQLLINACLIRFSSIDGISLTIIILSSSIVFIFLRFIMEGPNRLLKRKS